MPRAVNRLSLISLQDALCLLRASFSALRVQHLLRCSPSLTTLVWFLSAYSIVSHHYCNCDLTYTQWLQASLTIRESDLGVRQVASLALPAFLASAASTQSLQAAILPSHFYQVDSVFQSYKDRWLTILGPVPTGNSSHKQSACDRPGLKAGIAPSTTSFHVRLPQLKFQSRRNLPVSFVVTANTLTV